MKSIYLTRSAVLSVDEPAGVCVCDGRHALLQGAAGGRVVRVRVDDRVLGELGAAGDVPRPRHGEVPRHPLAHDRVRLLRALDLLLLRCRPRCCGGGDYKSQSLLSTV